MRVIVAALHRTGDGADVAADRGSEVAEIPPEQCPNGHRLRGGLVWVRHSPCILRWLSWLAMVSLDGGVAPHAAQ